MNTAVHMQVEIDQSSAPENIYSKIPSRNCMGIHASQKKFAWESTDRTLAPTQVKQATLLDQKMPRSGGQL
jgi:hypothetical protein